MKKDKNWYNWWNFEVKKKVKLTEKITNEIMESLDKEWTEELNRRKNENTR